MFVVSYFDGTQHKGLLAFAEARGGIVALGGIDPGEDSQATDPVTVITDDEGQDVQQGWTHPDDIVAHRTRFNFLSGFKTS